MAACEQARGFVCMSDADIAATAAALAARLPPEGWRVATDEEGRDYLYNNQGEVRWADDYLSYQTATMRLNKC